MRIVCIISLLLLFGCGGIITNTINPPVSEGDTTSTDSLPPGVTKDVLKMHQSLVKMQAASTTILEMPKPRFTVSWGRATDVTEYRIYRGIGIDSLQTTQLIGVVPYPDTIFVDSTVAVNTRYIYRVTCYVGSTEKESVKSTPVTGAWINLGPLVKEREKITLRGYEYTTNDLMIVTIPSCHPSDVVWTKTPVEKVTWIGQFDVDKNCKVDLSDLSLYAQQVYNKSACDSTAITH